MQREWLLSKHESIYRSGSGNAVNVIQQQQDSPQQVPTPQAQQISNRHCNYRYQPGEDYFASRMRCFGCGVWPSCFQMYLPKITTT